MTWSLYRGRKHSQTQFSCNPLTAAQMSCPYTIYCCQTTVGGKSQGQLSIPVCPTEQHCMFKSPRGRAQLTQNESDPSFLERGQANLLMCSSPALSHRFRSPSDAHGMAQRGWLLLVLPQSVVAQESCSTVPGLSGKAAGTLARHRARPGCIHWGTT